MKYALYISVSLALLVQVTLSETLRYDNFPAPTGGWHKTSWVEQGFLTSGSFGQSGTQDPNRSSNDSTGFLDIIHGDHLIVSLAEGGLFHAVSVDLAEYSTVYRFQARIEFFATRFDGALLSAVFLTDGLFDGPSGIQDFQTFYFPESFNNLVSLHTKTINIFSGDHPFSMDNLTVQSVPEANSISYLVCAGLVFAFRRFARRRSCGLTMRCSEPGMTPGFAIHASRAPGR